MSQINLGGALFEIPNIPGRAGSASISNVTLNATGETLHMCGQVYFAGGYSAASKTISAAGGGKIYWYSATNTFADAGTTFKIGIQDLSTASNPAQGDGSFDVYASLAGGGGGVATNAVNATTMTSGTKSLVWGQQIATTFEMTARAGADSVQIAYGNPQRGSSSWALPMCSDNTGGSYARTVSAYPMGVIQFDDGSLAYIVGSYFLAGTSSTQDFALNSGAADEYGNCYRNTVPVSVIGAVINGYPYTSTSADCEVIIYSDPFGTPVAERIYVWDATIGQTTVTGEKDLMFSSPFIMLPNTDYVIAVRPTVDAQNMRIYYNSMPTEAIGSAFGFGQYCYSVRRLNNTGAFSDYNGGTAKTRYMHIAILSNAAGQDVNNASFHLGI